MRYAVESSHGEPGMEKENRDVTAWRGTKWRGAELERGQLYTCRTGTDESNVTGVVVREGNRWSSRKHRLYKSRYWSTG